jgi:hypothetical protein
MTPYMQRADRLELVTQATAKVTGMRFCAHHQGEVPVQDGAFVLRNRSRRWICYRCQEHSQRHRSEKASGANRA